VERTQRIQAEVTIAHQGGTVGAESPSLSQHRRVTMWVHQVVFIRPSANQALIRTCGCRPPANPVQEGLSALSMALCTQPLAAMGLSENQLRPVLTSKQT
jgi:hypothetical protein